MKSPPTLHNLYQASTTSLRSSFVIHLSLHPAPISLCIMKVRSLHFHHCARPLQECPATSTGMWQMNESANPSHFPGYCQCSWDLSSVLSTTPSPGNAFPMFKLHPFYKCQLLSLFELFLRICTHYVSIMWHNNRWHKAYFSHYFQNDLYRSYIGVFFF